MSIAVPFHVPRRQVDLLRDEINAALAIVLDSGWYVLGTQVRQFEEEFAAFCGARHCVTVGNGTDALELALRGLNVGLGDEVITAGNAGGYTTTASFAVGATPVFADINARTLLVDPAEVGKLITPRTKIVVATHLYGKLADVDGLRRVITEANSKAILLEDCAQAHGATAPDQRRAGTLGYLATFSFYPTKNLGALGDGGALTTNDDELAARLRSLRQYGWTNSKYQIDVAGGRNTRMDEIQAAILRVKLGHVVAGNARRREIVARYAEAAGKALLFPHVPAGFETAAHLCVARGPYRAAIREQLAAFGIATAIHYPIPDHLQPALMARPERWRAGPLPETETACSEIFSLPCYPEMDDSEIDLVATALSTIGKEGS